MTDEAKKLLSHLYVQDDEIEDRINSGIENNRKGYGEFILKDEDGNAIEKATVTLKQTKHEFHFGSNAFMLNQFPDEEHNARYEECFANVFNLAVVPFYWSDLEPEDGHTRFTENSEFIYRRPQPDVVLDFCRKNSITPKGHPLLWHCFRPQWLTLDKAKMERRIRRRFEEIALRYRDEIKIWDVCNEAQTMQVGHHTSALPDNHVELAFELAAEYFPDSARTYNDDRMWFHYSKRYSPVYLLMRSLLDRGYKVNALGLQYHMFDWQLHYAEKFMSPYLLFNCLDTYGELGVPINFSEVSITSRRNLGDGDQFQEMVTRMLYRLWFSHAAVNGIIWWNLVDGTAAYAPIGTEDGENSMRAGLVNYDMTPKPAYNTLYKLINEEWQSNSTFEYRAGKCNKFKGFYGEYNVIIVTPKGRYKGSINLSKHSLNTFVINIGKTKGI